MSDRVPGGRSHFYANCFLNDVTYGFYFRLRERTDKNQSRPGHYYTYETGEGQANSGKDPRVGGPWDSDPKRDSSSSKNGYCRNDEF